MSGLAAGIGVAYQIAAELALQESEHKLRAAARLAHVGYWEHDLAANRVSWSEESCQVLGVPLTERSRTWDEFMALVHPDDRHVLSECRTRVARGEPGYRVAFRLVGTDGVIRYAESIGEAVRNESGLTTRTVGAIQDVSERKQAEETLRGTEEQYRQSQKMQAIGQLAGGIAHDFNNLLIVINGYAELVAKDLGPSHRSQQDLEEIRAAGRSAASLTRQLLAFSRRQILQPQVLDLNHVLRRMQQLLGRLIGEHITLVMNLSALGRVQADPGQIEQVIVNLAVNARDAMPEGGRLLIQTADAELDADYVARHRGATVGKHVLIAVSDTGIGMDDETRAHVFEPFFTTKPAGQGTGLGLATVYGIVKQSGGSIWVYSEPGKGATFKIYLPVVDAAAAAPELPVDTHALRGTETVLVIEDQTEVRELIQRTLIRYGYVVIAASSGPEAIAAARTHDGPIHVLLSDVVLPGGSGREIAREVAAARPFVRVLYMSGYTDEAIVQHGVLEPGLAFIQKPFTGDTLARKLREVLDTEQPPRF